MTEKIQVEKYIEDSKMNSASVEQAGADAQPWEKTCPACKAKKVRRSQMRGLLERGLLKPLGVKAYRCECCDHRFYRFGSRSQHKAQRVTSSNGAASLKQSSRKM
jgi:hypothetical protein